MRTLTPAPDNHPKGLHRMRVPSIEDRFPSSATSGPPTDEQRGTAIALHSRVVELAEFIDAVVPDGRDKSIALTSLEDVLMRANRAVYGHRPPAGVPTPIGPPTPTEAAGAAFVERMTRERPFDPGISSRVHQAQGLIR